MSDSKRNLPSWMSSRKEESNPSGKKEQDQSNVDKNEKNNEGDTRSSKKYDASGTSNFSKLLDGVVFVLSGFVNPERSLLRSHALEMGGEYRADWGSDCTLLICAFSNTPKFRQVEADCGTIVSKEWISECYAHKKLVEIEQYLMFAGKPWRRSSVHREATHAPLVLSDQQPSSLRKSQEHVEKESHSKKIASTSSKNVASKSVKEQFPPSKVKKWVIDDLNKTVSWLGSREEKPGPSEIKDIAAQGILTFIQDVIDTLEQNQDIQQVTEQWEFIPHVIEELRKLDDSKGCSNSISKEELLKQAFSCKRIYEAELKSLANDSAEKNKRHKSIESEKGTKGKDKNVSVGYDSDETIEMTEEEIDLADRTIASRR